MQREREYSREFYSADDIKKATREAHMILKLLQAWFWNVFTVCTTIVCMALTIRYIFWLYFEALLK